MKGGTDWIEWEELKSGSDGDCSGSISEARAGKRLLLLRLFVYPFLADAVVTLRELLPESQP